MAEVKRRNWAGFALRAGFTALCLGYLAWTIPFLDRVHLKGGGELRGTVVFVQTSVSALFVTLPDGTQRGVEYWELASTPEGSVTLGFLGALRRMRWGGAAPAIAFLILNQFVMALRWRILLAAQGLALPYLSVLRLHVLGLFFNITLPGQTGGDIAKAYAAARAFPGKGPAAVVSVFVDRLAGLVTLAALAAVASAALFLRDPRFSAEAWGTGALFSALAAGTAFYLSPWKARLMSPAALKRLPAVGAMAAELDQALDLYRHRRRAVAWSLALSVVNHAGFAFMGYLLGRSLGIPWSEAHPGHYLALIPIVSMAGCIPAGMMGFGIGDLAYVHEFGRLGVASAQAWALSLLTRLLLILMGLAAGLGVLVTRNRRTGSGASPGVCG